MEPSILDAARDGRVEEVKAYVERDAGLLSVKGLDGSTPLISAAYGGSAEVVEYILDQHVDVNQRNGAKRTALHVACNFGWLDVVRLLLRRGADVMAEDKWGDVPLLDAARQGFADVVDVLLRHGEECGVDAVGGGGSTALHLGCYKGYEEVVAVVLKAGADPCVLDSNDNTPLELAGSYQHPRCAQLIEEWEAACMLTGARRLYDAVAAKEAAAAAAASSSSGGPMQQQHDYSARLSDGLLLYGPGGEQWSYAGCDLSRVAMIGGFANRSMAHAYGGSPMRSSDASVGLDTVATCASDACVGAPVDVDVNERMLSHGGVVAMYAVSELKAELFVELVETLSQAV